MLAALLIAVFLGGGVSYAAEVALPGDRLYWVKTEVNEEVGDWVSVTGRAQVAWDARKVERRLEEAETLAADDRLTPEARVEIETRLAANFDDFAARIAAVKEKDADAAHEASANFEAALRAHQSVLTRIESRGEHDDLEPVERRVRVALGAVTDVRIGLEAAHASSTAYFKNAALAKAAAASKKIEQARQVLASARAAAVAEAEIEAEAEAKLALAIAAFNQGESDLSAAEHERAFRDYQLAHQLAQEAKLIIVSEASLKSDGRNDDRNDYQNKGNQDKRREATSTDDSLDISADGAVRVRERSTDTDDSRDSDDSRGVEVDAGLDIEGELGGRLF